MHRVDYQELLSKTENGRSGMSRFVLCIGILGTLLLSGANCVLAQNPLVMDQFTADPTARVFEGKMYVYPSHDIPASPGRGRANWFVMED